MMDVVREEPPPARGAEGELDGRGAVTEPESPEPVLQVFDLEHLYRCEARRLLGMLVAFTGDRAEAEDLLQEAFLRVLRSWDRIADQGKAAAYLRSTAFNLARSGGRRRSRAARHLRLIGGNDVAVSAETGAGVAEREREVARALADLPERQRACVILRYYADASVADIAETLRIAPTSVKTHLRRGLEALERRLEGLR